MFTRWILLFTITIRWLTSSDAVYVYSLGENLVESSGAPCPADGLMVCGIRGKEYFLFPNQCTLDELNKDLLWGTEHFRKLPMNHCIRDCNLKCPKVYRPICALNIRTQQRNVFVSLCELTRHACQTNMEFIQLKITDCQLMEILSTSQKTLAKRSKKNSRSPIPCTRIFKPVCGTYMGVKSTFRNECLLNAENITFGKDWRLVKNGVCDEDKLKNRPKINKEPKAHSIRKRSYDKNNYIQYSPRNAYSDYNPQLPLNYINAYSNIYTMPQIYQPAYHQVDPQQKNFNSEDVLKRIIALRPPPQDGSPQEEDDQQIEASDTKPMHFSMNSMRFNYRPVQDNREDSAHDTNPIDSYEENNVHRGRYYYPYHSGAASFVNKEMENDSIVAVTNDTPVRFTTPTTAEYVMSIPRTPFRPITLEEENQSTKIQTLTKSTTCKFGETPICGVLSNGTVRTFETVCEMMSNNMYLKSTWVKLHEGRCESCKSNCSREYTPVCVQRNGVNYTMVNDCYYNMGICMDKISKWKKITDGECKRYTRILDKYEHLQAGFKYTSSYYVSNDTEEILPSSTTELTTSSIKTAAKDTTTSTASTVMKSLSKMNTQSLAPKRNKTRKTLPKRVVRRRSNSRASMNAPFSNLSPSMDSYVMNLVKSKDDLNGLPQ